MCDRVERGRDVPHSQHGAFSRPNPATPPASATSPAPAPTSSELCWRLPSKPIVRSLAVAESCSHWRRRVGDAGHRDSGNIGRVCGVVSGSVESLGSILQHHGVVTMVVPTEVAPQTEALLVIVSAPRPLRSRSVASGLVPSGSTVSGPAPPQDVLQRPPSPLYVERRPGSPPAPSSLISGRHRPGAGPEPSGSLSDLPRSQSAGKSPGNKYK